MNFGKCLLLALLGLSLFTACEPKTPPAGSLVKYEPAAVSIPDLPTSAQPRLKTAKLFLGPQTITAEVATTQEETRAGLMFRKEMPFSEGMLFVFPYVHQTAFWMKNCSLPLTVAYIDDAGVIQELHDLEPFNTNSVQAARANIQFALEMNRGWFRSNDIPVGTLLRTEKGSLQETFFKQP